MRLAIVAATLLTAVSAHAAQADDIDDLATEASVNVDDLRAAIDAQPGVDAREYLEFDGELAAPVAPAPSNGWPIGGALGQRIYCVEAIESNHGAAMYNPQPWHGEHASGWLGFLPSTAQSVGVTIGNRASEWQGAAFMLTHGRGREFAGVMWGRC